MAEPVMDTSVTRQGQQADADSIMSLINSAFLVEKFFVDGDRVTPRDIERLLGKGTFWLIEDGRTLAGCVYVELQDES
jgi:hypothetical protein